MMGAPKVIFLMADYGHDPTGNKSISLFITYSDSIAETAIPWRAFNDANCDIYFATENGKKPACDEWMLRGVTGTLLGASKAAKDAYEALSSRSDRFAKPLSWPDVKIEEYDLVFLPGGHDKQIRKILDSDTVHKLLATYFPKTNRPSSKCLGAICHGVQGLANASFEDGKSVLHDVKTTALQQQWSRAYTRPRDRSSATTTRRMGRERPQWRSS